MQGVGLPGLTILKDLGSLVSIDGRPLMFAFAVCGGAATYFSISFEPALESIWVAAGLAFVVWMAARRWWTSDLAITLVMVIFSVLPGMLAGSVRTRLVEAPVVASETRPSLSEGWVQDVEPGRRVVRLLTKVHSISGLSAAATDAECAEMLCEFITASGVDVSATMESGPTIAIGADET